MADIVVVGSASIDFSVTAPHLPQPGETVLGHRFFQVCGGKGANQAVACALLGARVAMVAKVGDDPAGKTILAALQDAGVDTSLVSVDPTEPSGTAHITVDDRGENAIVVVPGSNQRLTPADIDRAQSAIAGAKLVMIQLEIPLVTVLHTLQVAHAAGVPVMLDPAPAPHSPLPEECYRFSTWATPNENETAALCGMKVDGPASAAQAVRVLKQRGITHPVVKLGALGSVCEWDGTMYHVPAFQVKTVDTTAAGDSFAAGLAVALVEGKPTLEALRLASACGALTATRPGAQPALPRRNEVEAMLARGVTGAVEALS